MENYKRRDLQALIENLKAENERLQDAQINQDVLHAQLCRAQKFEALACLAGGIAHDFNNILQSILGYTQFLLISKDIAEREYDALEQIEKIIARGRELTRQFLSYGGKTQARFDALDLNTQIRETIELLRRTVPRMIAFHLDLTSDLNPTYGDAGQCGQVLMNLCLNAVDAMDEKGSLTLSSENIVLTSEHRRGHGIVPPGQYALVSVTDNGCGMSPETIGNIFKPYFTTKIQGKGTGLGLATVYSIMKAHASHIECISQVGCGTTFRLFFPTLEGQARPQQKTLRNATPPSVTGSETILMVDDEADLLSLGKEMLEQYDYTVLTAETGEEAIREYGRCGADLVLLDVGMPGMGGLECLRKLLAIDPQAKIVITSGYSDNSDVERALAIGAQDFLTKPYPIDILLATVRTVLDTSRPNDLQTGQSM